MDKLHNTFIPAFTTILRNNEIRIIGILVIVLILSLLLYMDSLSQLAASVIGRDDSSHGLFVPFIAAFFLWEQRKKIKNMLAYQKVRRVGRFRRGG